MTSNRRAARRTAHVQRFEDGIPPEFRDQLHPIWRDAEALWQKFPDLMTERTASRLAMGGRVYHQIASAWCMANGYESQQWPNSVDWRAFRAALGAASLIREAPLDRRQSPRSTRER